jgi:hypothetical protein
VQSAEKKNSKTASIERLQNSLDQAKINGDTALAKKIKAIIDRIKDDDDVKRRLQERRGNKGEGTKP